MQKLYNEIKFKVIKKIEDSFESFLASRLNKLGWYQGGESSLASMYNEIDMFLPLILKTKLAHNFNAAKCEIGVNDPYVRITTYKWLLELLKSDNFVSYTAVKMCIVCALNQYNDPCAAFVSKGLRNSVIRSKYWINEKYDSPAAYWENIHFEEFLNLVNEDFMSDLLDDLRDFSAQAMDTTIFIDRVDKSYDEYIKAFEDYPASEAIAEAMSVAFHQSLKEYIDITYSNTLYFKDMNVILLSRFKRPISRLLLETYDLGECRTIQDFMDDEGIVELIEALAEDYEIDEDTDGIADGFDYTFEEVLHEVYPNCFVEEKPVSEDDAD